MKKTLLYMNQIYPMPSSLRSYNSSIVFGVLDTNVEAPFLHRSRRSIIYLFLAEMERVPLKVIGV